MFNTKKPNPKLAAIRDMLVEAVLQGEERAVVLRQRALPPEPPRIAATDRSACGARERTALGSVQRREGQRSR